jgi:hypothetical protein
MIPEAASIGGRRRDVTAAGYWRLLQFGHIADSILSPQVFA